jgi:hypothetical protein
MNATEVENAASKCAMDVMSQACLDLQEHFKATSHHEDTTLNLYSMDIERDVQEDGISTLALMKDNCYGNKKDHHFHASQMPSTSIVPSKSAVYPVPGEAEVTSTPMSGTPTSNQIIASEVPSVGTGDTPPTDEPEEQLTMPPSEMTLNINSLQSIAPSDFDIHLQMSPKNI